MSDLVLYEARPPAAVLTLNRPDRRNALSRALIAELTEAFRRAQDDPAVRCVILTGAGTEAKSPPDMWLSSLSPAA